MRKIGLALLAAVVSVLLISSSASGDSKKDCKDRCFKEYSKCRKKAPGCIQDKQACEKACK